ncbi:MAG: glycosyltransferase [Actinomycetota bacterium]
MIVLLVVPDYASHWYPLSAVAGALRARGNRVVVATGPALAPLVAAGGHEHVELTLGSGSNTGVRPSGADAEIDAFFAATREGMIATLQYQAERRRHDLLWEPQAVAERLRRIVARLAPDTVLVDQLAFSATAALRGLRVPFLSFLPGHPCQLPGRGQIFGYPELRPPAFTASAAALRSLRELCTAVSTEFTAAYNASTLALDPTAEPLDDAFAAGGTLGTLVNYPRQVGAHAGRLPHASFLGSCIRSEEPGTPLASFARERTSKPRAYVSLGSFLSARTDVLQRIVQAVRLLGWDAVIATGATEPQTLGPLPSTWVVAEHLPQVAALDACDVVVCHGGNNTVTEALTAGLPVLAAPFSTDQFAGAEDLHRAGLGEALDPATVSADAIAARLTSLLDGGAAPRAAALGAELRCAPGAEFAAEIVELAAVTSVVAA